MNPSSSESASDDKVPTILIVSWTLTVLMIVVVTDRIYIRAGLLHHLGVDDWLIVFSLLMGLVCCIFTTINVRLSFGKHAWLLSAAILAVTAMLNRILNASHIQPIISGVCIIILFTMGDLPRALWQTSLVAEGKATCKNLWMLIDYAIFTGALSGFVDLVLVNYSSTVLMKSHMSLRKRLTLCAALGLGSGYVRHSFARQGIESSVGIIAPCIPTLQPLLDLMLGNRTASSYNSSRKGSNLPEYSHGSHSKSLKLRKMDFAVATAESQKNILSHAKGRGGSYAGDHSADGCRDR
ncbi:uncharacterized protein BO72DRAFT_470655 [Aspergillus fijiensis CBS 313.89]|uniref:Integral membrane protein n=1 Tax=Aspergillus fijiensis CBS 313.89 TaxID=1448319 RepID=A0A8G1VVL8_9EURO|nr:uncharacterized protein BO72DRAFT_470655 [Aspergillus fijiensis CBS 313.89]RAK74625.1 hypothetical protein BO72DRAFT_470655 [Aspergillus fijiensis CBS 313.89]